ncbi:MAG: sensor histidine kinase KdpD [Thermoanaerobaculia bacterium]|nr:sensor histidine kinase KdpD [Thermoanaerobaculia bacterium]
MPTADRRPDPEALLAQAAAEEGGPRRGKLEVFLGAAPGVGKTYAMLGAARERARQGVDVVVGLVETHGRAETEALLAGLAVLPRRTLVYKGKELEELDLDALLARRPQLALVDELAHTNAPGVRHERRHQDVAELLDAGIDVLTTLNVQHLESLNDVVAQVTGVRVRETVPDSFFDRPHEVVLIDLPPRELIERLRQGKVYVPERAQAALERYFSPSNLAALRELALQTAANRVDADLRGYLAARGESGTPIRPRIVVAIDGDAEGEILVRAARRLAERRRASWTVAHVEVEGARTGSDPMRLHAAFQLARRLGGETVVLRGAGVAEELASFVHGHAVSVLLVGRTRRGKLSRRLGRALCQQLLTMDLPCELTVVPTSGPGRRTARAPGPERPPWPARLRDLGEATAVVALATALGAWIAPLLPVASLALVYLTAVIAVAVRTRRLASIYAALLSFLTYNFFFTDPRLSFRIHGPHDLVAVVSFLAAALLCGHLAWRVREQVVRLRAANEHAHLLRTLGERLAAAADETQVLAAGCAQLAQGLGAESLAAVRESPTGPLRRAAAVPATASLGENDLAAAHWVAAHGQPAGRFTGTLAGSAWWLLPLAVEGGCLGVIGLRLPAAQERLGDESRRLAEAIVQQVALAADRARLVASLEAARLEGETERLRTALLSSVSHDLRSPLAAMIGAATSLSTYGEAISGAERQELLEAIRSEGERLDRYIQNLLDMTRLGSGPMRLVRDWTGCDEILSAALTRLARLFPEAVVRAELPPDLPLLYVHPALVEQALFNILENAAKFSPPGEAIAVRAAARDGRLVLDIVDRGPGIPESERRQVFDLFYRASRGDRAPRGSGLGLTIVRGLIGAHGGRVEALPGADGTGTTIRVTLPLPEPPPGEAKEESA